MKDVNQLKVVHINSLNKGGAFNAAKNISEAVSTYGIQSEIYTLDSLFKSKISFIIYVIKYLIYTILYRKSKIERFFFFSDLMSMDISKDQKIKEADIIHLHWVSKGMLGLKGLESLFKLNKPIVWTLHDMHPFTGGCYYDENCGLYESGCINCPMCITEREKKRIRKVAEKKRRVFRNNKITWVGCSKWITECANNSKLIDDSNCKCINNCVDTSVFRAEERIEAKKKLGIKTDKIIIGFGAMVALDDLRKGYFLLKKSIQFLDSSKYAIIIFGARDREISLNHMDVYSVGRVTDSQKMRDIYSCMHVFAAPSLQENFANTLLEAGACRVPTVAFDVGGMGEIIHHNYSGYIARPYDIEDFAKGIEICSEKSDEYGNNAYHIVTSKYTKEIVGKKYSEIYKSEIRK